MLGIGLWVCVHACVCSYSMRAEMNRKKPIAKNVIELLLNSVLSLQIIDSLNLRANLLR